MSINVGHKYGELFDPLRASEYTVFIERYTTAQKQQDQVQM